MKSLTLQRPNRKKESYFGSFGITFIHRVKSAGEGESPLEVMNPDTFLNSMVKNN